MGDHHSPQPSIRGACDSDHHEAPVRMTRPGPAREVFLGSLLRSRLDTPRIFRVHPAWRLVALSRQSLVSLWLMVQAKSCERSSAIACLDPQRCDYDRQMSSHPPRKVALTSRRARRTCNKTLKGEQIAHRRTPVFQSGVSISWLQG